MISYDEFFFSFEKFEISCVCELLLLNLVIQENRNAVTVNVSQVSTYSYIASFQQHQPQTQSAMQPAPSQVQKSSSTGTRHITNPAISALVTSLMNSAQQFQQQAAGKAV
jgi:hypothetical protein